MVSQALPFSQDEGRRHVLKERSGLEVRPDRRIAVGRKASRSSRPVARPGQVVRVLDAVRKKGVRDSLCDVVYASPLRLARSAFRVP